MSRQKKCGRKPPRYVSDAMPTGTLREFDRACSESLSGKGKHKLPNTYRTRDFLGKKRKED